MAVLVILLGFAIVLAIGLGIYLFYLARGSHDRRD
jgi:hypothetical protein